MRVVFKLGEYNCKKRPNNSYQALKITAPNVSKASRIICRDTKSSIGFTQPIDFCSSTAQLLAKNSMMHIYPVTFCVVPFIFRAVLFHHNVVDCVFHTFGIFVVVCKGYMGHMHYIHNKRIHQGKLSACFVVEGNFKCNSSVR